MQVHKTGQAGLGGSSDWATQPDRLRTPKVYLLPTVSIFYVQVGLCHIFRDYDGRWQISEVRRTRHEYYGTKSSFVLPLIFADEIIFFIVIVPNDEI